MIPYGKQSIDQQDIEAVVRVLESGMLTTGPLVEEFEKAFAAKVGAEHAVVVSNATAALHLAMLVAGIGEGDRVVTSPNTFLASANCAAYVGAIPDFSDIDPVTYNLCPKALADTWKTDTKAVVAVAYAGQSADLPAITKVAHRHGAIVIEDACHGTGGGFEHGGKSYKLGGHPWADMTTFSFHPVKTMTTGEGGILVTNNAEYAQKARLLRSHGVERSADKFLGLGSSKGTLTEKGPWYYEMQSLGYNFRITDFQCALGLSQLSKIDGFIERRQEIVATYNRELSNLENLTTPGLHHQGNELEISWHLYTVLINFEKIGMSRSEVMAEMRKHGVGSQVLYIPVYLQPFYRENYGYKEGKCPTAEWYYEHCLSLPLYPSLTDDDVESVVKCVKKLTT
ncbi:UDP-4-amino-4,6-dideoxy-N-acetyl-beta-L-altrosamine transaminase [bacterium]|nr:UDP-4-amino-4,6-dideoxy-N-acetyl-beta-L-altrosamine transaminase [Akkermansiaceae bacterium]MDB4577243.1 UDP-4-amino-4,6-dideoxy-N-acetyl-beta-L-altrosamine transaminase [bacterium]